jgi:hypothetical protein
MSVKLNPDALGILKMSVKLNPDAAEAFGNVNKADPRRHYCSSVHCDSFCASKLLIFITTLVNSLYCRVAHLLDQKAF